jgi:hypothetical protein
VAIAIGQIRAPAVRIGKQLDGRSQMLFQLPPRTQNFFARFSFRHRAEIDVRARVSPKLKSAPVQGAHLIPGHPRVTNADLLVPPRDDIGAHPLRHDEKRRGKTQLLEDRRGMIEVVAIPVIESNRQLAIQFGAILDLGHEVEDIVLPLARSVQFEPLVREATLAPTSGTR